jgi:hypothetical protein
VVATFALVALEATTAQNDLVAASFTAAAACCLILGGGPVEGSCWPASRQGMGSARS